MKKNIFFLLTVSVFLFACSSLPSPEELASADYGSFILQTEAETKAVDFLSMRLKDPQSAQYKWGTVYKGYIKKSLLYGGGFEYGYILNVAVNSKNSFGGYTGYKQFVFLFYNKSIKSVYAEVQMDYGNSFLGKIY